MADGSLYVVGNDQELTAEWLNQLLGDIHTRIRTIEAIKAELDRAIGELTAVGLKRIDDVVSPLIAQAQKDVAQIQTTIQAIAQQIADLLLGAVPANSVVESADRVFLTPGQRAQISEHAAAIVQMTETLAPQANAVLSGLLRLSGALKMTGSVTTPALAADAHDYAPADLATAVRVRLSATAERSITGLVAAEDGRVIVLENIGAYDVTLKAQSNASAAVNRFASHADIVLTKQGGAATLMYDGPLERWTVTGGGKVSDLKVGDLLESAAAQGPTFLKADGALYLNAGYPALRAVLGPYQNPLVARIPVNTGTTPMLSRANGLWLAFVNTVAQWKLYSSPDLINWTERTSPMQTIPVRKIRYGAGLYVAFDGYSGSPIYTSPDLVTWTARPFSWGGGYVLDMDWNGVEFVAVITSDDGHHFARSADGVTWTRSASVAGSAPKCVAFAGGRWIALATSTSYWSANGGLTWTEVGNGFSGEAYKVASGGGKVVFVTSSRAVFSTSDGVAFVQATVPNPNNGFLRSISYDGGGFVICGDSLLIRSADLQTWSSPGAASTDFYDALHAGPTANDPYVITSNAAGVLVGWDLSTTQFQVPTINGRAANTNVYIKAL